MYDGSLEMGCYKYRHSKCRSGLWLYHYAERAGRAFFFFFFNTGMLSYHHLLDYHSRIFPVRIFVVNYQALGGRKNLGFSRVTISPRAGSGGVQKLADQVRSGQEVIQMS